MFFESKSALLATRNRLKNRLPVVMSRDEVKRVPAAMSGVSQLMAKLLYGCGFRLMECVRLRVHAIDFDINRIAVRDGKGMKDRAVMLPAQLKAFLWDQIEKVKIDESGLSESGQGRRAERRFRHSFATHLPEAGYDIGLCRNCSGMWMCPPR